MNQRPGTKLMEKYISLPVATRFRISKELNLVKEGEDFAECETKNLDKMSAEFLVRAYNGNLLYELWNKLFDNSIENPFKK